MTDSPSGTEDPLWPTWRALVKAFGFGRLFMHLSTSLSGAGFYGADVVSTLRATRMAKAGLEILEPVSDTLLQRLLDLAEINARRNEAMWRMAALFYVTVPVTLILAGLERTPRLLELAFAEIGWILAFLAVGLTLQLLYYFANQWRARQIEAVIGLARIERAGR
ncbi:hypothetical protein ACIQC9_04475 [Brevundimonas sp. NPDC092305]|uniref:hypothetical protein n=1 Tax=Brevundimonas sp. NPDC092305 TaxID=3363957 RepID=UPI003801824A